MDLFARPDAGPDRERRHITHIAISCAALLGLSVMSGCECLNMWGCTPSALMSARGRTTAIPDPPKISIPDPPKISFIRSRESQITELLALQRYNEALNILNHLAALYEDEGYYVEYEPIFNRALMIMESALGPEHLHIAQCLENYAVVLRGTMRDVEATEMVARAKAIRAKLADQNPAQ